MINKIKTITIAFLLIISILNISYSNPTHASTNHWYTSTTNSDSSDVIVTIDHPDELTNKPITITIDATNYNNGDNVIVYNPGDNNFIVTYGSKYSIKVNSNGNYDFMVERKDYYDPKFGDPKTIWCHATINNIDTTKPVITYKNTWFDKETAILKLVVNVKDDIGTYRVKLINGEYASSTDDVNSTSGPGLHERLEYIPIYKNGTYTVEAEDFAGNKTLSTFKISNCNPIPLTVDKLTIHTKYITGKALPNARLIIRTNESQYRYYNDTIRADKKGYFKVKLDTKLILNESIRVAALDANAKSKYMKNVIYVKVFAK